MTDSGTMKDTMRTTSSSAKMKAVANEPRAKEKVKDPGKKQKHIDNADADEPSALPVSSGGSLARRYEYTMFYFLAITSWCLEITAGVVGSIYGGDSHVFIGTVTAFLVTHWYANLPSRDTGTLRVAADLQTNYLIRAAFLQTCWMMATASRHTLGDRMAYLNLACRFQRLCAVCPQRLLKSFSNLSTAHCPDWHGHLGGCISIQGQSLKQRVLDYLPCGMDH